MTSQASDPQGERIEDTNVNTVEFLEELEAFDPQYKTRYTTLRLAAYAAGLAAAFTDWLETPDGIRYSQTANAHDHTADNAVRKAQIDSERKMQERGRVVTQRGYLTEGDGA
jgi:hypothetical protein